MMALLGMAARNVLSGGRRNVLLAAAIALISFAIVLVSALFAGMTDRLVTYGQTLHSGNLNIIGYHRDFAGRMSATVGDVAGLEAALRAWRPDVEVAPRHRGQVTVFKGSTSLNMMVHGVMPARETRLWAVLQKQGLEARDPNEPLPARGMVLFAAEAKQLGAGLGDELVVWGKTERGAFNTTRVVVTAIAEDLPVLSEGYGLLRHEDLAALLGQPADQSGVVLVYVPGARPQQLASLVPPVLDALRAAGREVAAYNPTPSMRLREAMARTPWRGDRLAVNAAPNELEWLWWRWLAADAVTALLAAILAAIAIVGVSNAALVAVKQRTREIATLRALGLSRTKLAAMLVCEGLLLGGAAAGTGVALGGALGAALDAWGVAVGSEAFRTIYFSDVLSFTIRPASLLTTAMGFTLATAAACVWPAWRAARLAPAVALRQAA